VRIKCVQEEENTNPLAVGGSSVEQIKALIVASPFNLTVATVLEELVRVALPAGPNLQEDTVGGRAAGNVETFVTPRLVLSNERCDWACPDSRAVWEVWFISNGPGCVSSILGGASDEGYFGAVLIR
jgi:hypothetical protein